MSLSRTAARWLMRWTMHRPPPGRAEWALAMQREFDVLDRGELGWAMGCAIAMTGWKLRAQWLYLLLLCLAPFVVHAESQLEFALLTDGYLSRASFMAFSRNYGALVALLTPLPLALLLGAYRPHSIGTTLLFGCVLAQHVGGTLYAGLMLGMPFLSWWGPHATLYMLPAIVGLCASLAIWFAGAKLGARLVSRAAG